ncbi:LTA synthase family protein [Solimonas soli]|uniref:LTA synthase family protein n=1 Tax=Solimonas soli TaxID=413479 RepID=UPI00048A04A3|nr:sulfatase-like hydrolase/transferase [Solimonas soli]
MTATTILARRPSLALLGLGLLQAAATVWALWVSMQFSDDGTCALINAGLFAVPLLLMLAISGRWSYAVAFATLAAILFWAIGEFKLRYFDNRLALLDFSFLGEGANWSIVGRYPRLQWALAGFVVACLVLGVHARLARRGPAHGWRVRAACLVLLGGWSSFAWANRHHHNWEVFRDDADCGLLKICGVMSRLVYSYSVFEMPTVLPSGDSSRFEALLSSYRPAPVATSGAKPDVVVWLNESTFDPRGYAIKGARWPHLKMFDKRPETRAQGLLRVHTYGGKTWLSEFSVLTGLVPDDFGARRTTVFNAVAPHMRDNLVARFEANGYRTVVLMPTMKRFYGAGRTYESLGFDRVLTLRDFHEYDQIPGDEWDIADSERLAEAAVTLLKRNAADTRDPRPLFLYMLSIHEHAPYPKNTPVIAGLQQAELGKSLKGKLSDYSNKLVKLDRGIGVLESYLTQQQRRAVWAYFGDHQAYFEEQQPPYLRQLPKPDFLTQYQVRSNFRPLDPLAAPPLLDIALLPSLVADVAGLRHDTWFDGLSAMREACAGTLEDCEDAALVTSFKNWTFSPQLALLAR